MSKSLFAMGRVKSERQRTSLAQAAGKTFPSRVIAGLSGVLLWGACTLPGPGDNGSGGQEITAQMESTAPISGLEPAPANMGPTRTELYNADVTIVYPLPPASDISLMVWGNTLSNSYGRLVPFSAFSQITVPLDPRPGSHTATTGTQAWSALRLVALRLDPCFGSRGEVPDAQCKNQVRLVFQGVHSVGTQAVAEDGAVHVYYELPRAELLTLAREIVSLTDRAGSYTEGPLGVHPILARQGVWGTFGQGLKGLIRRYVGEDRAVRVTYMARSDSEQSAWQLGGFERNGTLFQRLQVPTTTTTEQALFAGYPNAGELAGSTPTPTQSEDDVRTLLNSSLARAVDDSVRRAAYAAALRIENPTRHTADTIDCVSCHVAMATRLLGETHFGYSSAGLPDLFTSTRDLSFVAPSGPSLENLHAASYVGTELGVSQRTVNDTAAVATALSALLK